MGDFKGCHEGTDREIGNRGREAQGIWGEEFYSTWERQQGDSVLHGVCPHSYPHCVSITLYIERNRSGVGLRKFVEWYKGYYIDGNIFYLRVDR